MSSKICPRQQTTHPLWTFIVHTMLKWCFYSNVYIEDNSFFNLACKNCREFSGTKGGETIFQVFGGRKKGQDRGTKALHTVTSVMSSPRKLKKEELNFFRFSFFFSLSNYNKFLVSCRQIHNYSVKKCKDMVHIKKKTRHTLRPVFEFLVKFHYS